jgi:hypothetical protein
MPGEEPGYPAAGRPFPMISPMEKPSARSSPRGGLILALREVIEALDRRVPQLERARVRFASPASRPS